MKFRPFALLFAAFVLAISCISIAHAQKAADATPPKEGVLTAAEVGEKLFPDKVYFKSQSAPVQARNSAGVRYSDGQLTLAALVDNSGYASGIREKYQAYLLTDVAIQIGGQTLKPGAYGFGFIEGNKVVVMDLGANDLFQVSSAKDAELKRPVPFQFLASSAAGTYRIYKGRDYVEFQRAK
jgi:hypothetical protein